MGASEAPREVVMTDTQGTDLWLQDFVRGNGGAAGSVHRVESGELVLAAAFNLPEPVRRVTARIPRGKGMAGLALERNAPVSTCNLKTDATGDVRPGAQAVDAKAAVALPVRDFAGEVRAVVGIAYPDERDLSDAELAELTEKASRLPA
jgi:L-methionine (R)-S-oxide reductase